MVNFHSSATTVLALFATLSAFDKVQAQGSSGGDKRAGRVGREDTTGANNDDRRVEFTVVDAEGNNAEENIQKKKSIRDEKKRTTESVGRRLKARFLQSESQADCGDDEFFGEITATGYWSLVTVNFVPVASGGGTESGCLPNAEIFIFIADEQESYTLKVDGAIIKAGDDTSSVESVIFGTADNCVLVKQSSTKSDNVANNALLHVTGNAIGDGDSSFAITKQESSPWWEVEFPFTAFADSKVMISSAPGEASLEDFNVRFFDENSMEMFSYWFSEAVDVGSPLEITLPTTGAKKMLIQMSPGKDRVLALSKVDFSSIDFSPVFKGAPDLSDVTFSFPKCDASPPAKKSAKKSKSARTR